MSTIETDAEVATRLEFEQTQRSEGWKLLRGMLRDQRRNLLIGALVGISWAGFKTAAPPVEKVGTILGKMISGNHFQIDDGDTIKMTLRSGFIERQTFRTKY
jgi:hypothetical protein